MAILERRRQAQVAVSAQESKIAELSALQHSLRQRLASMEAGEDEEEEEEEKEGEGEEEYEHEEAEATDEELEMQVSIDMVVSRCRGIGPPSGIVLGTDLPLFFFVPKERVLELLGRKTRECDELAGAVEHAREAGMDPDDARLHRAERALAERYAEVKVAPTTSTLCK